MHVIQTFGADGDLLDETEYTDREEAFTAYDEACRKANGRGKTTGVVMVEGGRITRRHGTVPATENTDAGTDVSAAPAAKHDVRERPRDKDVSAGARGRNGRSNPGRGKVSTAPVTAVGRETA
jgi:hypothetical protein